MPFLCLKFELCSKKWCNGKKVDVYGLRQNKRDTIRLARTRIEDMERLINQITNNDEFDEEIFKCIIDTITIEKTRIINFKFRCGIEIEETI